MQGLQLGVQIHAIIGQLLGDPNQLAGHHPADAAEDRPGEDDDNDYGGHTPQPEAMQ